jgi:hypothetical protein
MSYLVAAPEFMTSAATSLADIGSVQWRERGPGGSGGIQVPAPTGPAVPKQPCSASRALPDSPPNVRLASRSSPTARLTSRSPQIWRNERQSNEMWSRLGESNS